VLLVLPTPLSPQRGDQLAELVHDLVDLILRRRIGNGPGEQVHAVAVGAGAGAGVAPAWVGLAGIGDPGYRSPASRINKTFACGVDVLLDSPDGNT
jgi:hypothetical protein